jgi:hypothetical protein
MEEASGRIVDKIQALSDAELAVLLCLGADQHCIIETDKYLLDGLEQELGIVCLPITKYTSRTLI